MEGDMSKQGLTYLVIAVATSFFLGWLYGTNVVTKKQKENYSDSQYLIEISALEAKVVQLKQELNKLGLLKTQKKANAIADPDVKESNSIPAASDFSRQKESSEKIKSNVDKRYQRLAENYKNNKNYDFYSEVHKAYEAESYNEAWAEIRSQKLRNAFADEKALQNKSIKSIDCRSKHCRVDIFYQNKDDVEGLTEILTKLNLKRGKENLFIPSIDMNYSESEKIASIYLTDDPDASLY
jgi:hypothetical protein